MDFLFSTDPGDAPRIDALLPGAGLRAAGPWGSLAAGASCHAGLDPLLAGDAACLVLGDPLSDLSPMPPHPDDPPEGNARTARTLAWLRVLRAGARPRPVHPGSVILLRLRPEAEAAGIPPVIGITDASGLASVYALERPGGGLILSSSPDLIAGLVPCRLDRLTALELLASGCAAGPATLYEGIVEIGPGVVFTLERGRLVQRRWWTPPAPEPDLTLAEAAGALRRGVQDTARRIAAALGTEGWITLSSGLDSRYVASLLHDRLALHGVGIGQPGSVSLWVPAQVAGTLGFPYRAAERRPGHYVAATLDQTRSWPSHLLPTNAHDHDRALGEGIGPFLLGAYRADTILVRENPVPRARARLVAQGVLPPDAPDWAAAPVARDYSPETQAAITARHAAELAALGLDPAALEPGQRPLQWQRSPAKGHFDPARRNYPIYGPFLSLPLCNLSFRIRADRLTDPALPAAERKMAWYGPHLRRLRHVPVNPAASPAWPEMVAAIRRAMPKPL